MAVVGSALNMMGLPQDFSVVNFFSNLAAGEGAGAASAAGGAATDASVTAAEGMYQAGWAGGKTIGQMLAPEAAVGGETAALAETAAVAGEGGAAAAGGGMLGALGPLAAVAGAGMAGFEAGNLLAEHTALGGMATDAVGSIDHMLTGDGERSSLLRASEWVGDKTDAVGNYFGGLF